MACLDSFESDLEVCIIGASGGIGGAFLKAFNDESKVKKIYAFSRNNIDITSNKILTYRIDIEDEDSVIKASELISTKKSIDIIIVATGILHNLNISPEKNISQTKSDSIKKVFSINAVGPLLIAKYFIPLLNPKRKSIFAVLSARVGSIKDNRLGGWTSYRTSKAALNMLLKNISIEVKRKIPKCIISILHPGTVNSELSKPYQKNVPEGSLFEADYAARKLIKVIDNLNEDDSGLFYAWDGKLIDY
ncbi:MAG: hypothetical protein CBC38_00740 [Gammaproteobacteria bacterium TMED78]|nr:MAG: hypothetical protein CBC38_00740 [Gammaproteobacteria bacterium TMED78]|tara:strand:+ start:394 stop:1137 length:744 start_codon:yes stop_codon:yes gene_type:complete